MTRFVAIYRVPRSTLEQMAKATPEQMKSGMDAWMRWAKRNERAMLDLGSPLGKTKQITAQGIADTANDITGYSIVEADSLDAAAELFEGHPHLQLPGASVDVLECRPIPGM
jgi:hypothetical protein